MTISPSRLLAGFTLAIFFATHPAYASASPVPVLTVIDPTKRTFSYDPNGNLTEELAVGTGAKTLYAYDSLNRLTEVASVRAEPVEARTILATYTYDGEGKRLATQANFVCRPILGHATLC